jgi:hypothetical protein
LSSFDRLYVETGKYSEEKKRRERKYAEYLSLKGQRPKGEEANLVSYRRRSPSECTGKCSGNGTFLAGTGKKQLN